MEWNLLFSALIFGGVALAQTEGRLNEGDPFIETIEQSLMYFYKDIAGQKNYDSIIAQLNYEPYESPEYSDEVYCARIKQIAARTSMPFECNEPSLSIIRYFAKNRRNFTRVVMGRSAIYFDMFEEKLSEHGLPLELKYLAVIESGLRPQVRSRAGALGLWQFMYRTGKYFGLEESTYIDERMDPEKATLAACRYLKQLYGIYGDWFLALAAYNAGPGNVNKAIRRSGNKTTYWQVRPFLPRETQGYVPNFIAATYMFTFYAEHNIVPMPASIIHAQLDTLCLRQQVTMSQLSNLVDWELEEIKTLNPIYKTETIPMTFPPQCITGPLDKISQLAGREDELYRAVIQQPVADGFIDLDSEQSIAESAEEAAPTGEDEVLSVNHVVKVGETMSSIAAMYKVGVEEIQEWNNLKPSTLLYSGQVLKVYTTEEPAAPKPAAPAKKYYTVRRGDTFGVIAARHGLTTTQLRKLNPGVSVSRINVGQKLRVK